MTADRMIAQLTAGRPVPGRHVLVVAHPDDETISFGGALCCLADVVVVQLTEADAAREAERAAAQAAGGWTLSLRRGGVHARQTMAHVASLLALVRETLDHADVIWTHPYEGGHLDHDTAAWLVQTACEGLTPPLRMEFASYHMNATQQVFGNFWPPVETAALDAVRFRRKLDAVAAYRSQAHILRKFIDPAREPYRVAPTYDFTAPPPVPRCRWDVKGYQPHTLAWRWQIALAEVAA